MKQYPSISKEILRDIPVYAFNKLDGSNIRAEWNRKHKVFEKFGSRTVLLGEDHPHLGKSIAMIKIKYEESLSEIFLKERFENVVCFFEFYGEKSFAGFHDPGDETLKVTLIDVNVHKKGLLYPSEFIKLFQGRVEIPDVLYHGNLNQEIESLIRNGTMPGMSFEGVVCKASYALKKGYPPVMFKVKNNAWITKVKELCGEDEKLFQQLV